MRIPEKFENRMREMLGTEYDAFSEAMEEPARHGLRVNTGRISVEEFLRISPFSLHPVPWIPNGFYVDWEENPSKHPYFYAGLYYLQEPSAMTPAHFLPVEPGDRVLDLCAAPGGKSTELAVKLQGKGLLVSNDISSSRAKALLKNLEVFGIGNMIVTSEPPNGLISHFKGYFNKILVDAPCSGEGMFRKSASMVSAWERNGVEKFAKLQREILRDTVKLLAPGGLLLYSTCTFSPEEDEQSVEYLLSLDDTLSLVELPMEEGFDRGHAEWGLLNNSCLSRTRRLWPHRIEGEGHFVALVKNTESMQTSLSVPEGLVSSYIYGNGRLSPEAEAFLSMLSVDIDRSRIEVLGDRIFYMPEYMPDVGGLRLLRTGLLLGVMKKNRFEPSQALAMHLKLNEFPNHVSLPAQDGRVMKYLKGETIELNAPDGLVLFGVDGYPLGWGKVGKGVMKNKYLPGWRCMGT